MRRTRDDPHAQVLQVVAILRTPDLGQQLGVQHDLAGLAARCCSSSHSVRDSWTSSPSRVTMSALEVDLDVVEGQHAGTRTRAVRAAKDRPHARRQFIGMERLGDVVVGAEIQTLGLVGGGALRRQQDHRHWPALTQLPHDLDPIKVGHDDIEQDDVGADLLGHAEGLLAAVGRHDAEPLFPRAIETSLVIRGSSSATRTTGLVLNSDLALRQIGAIDRRRCDG